MRIFLLTLALTIGGSSLAHANCSDEFKEVQQRVAKQMQQRPRPPQAVAAAEQLKKANENMADMDEVDCYNAVARIRRTLATPAPPPEVKDAGPGKPR
jgi:hypothetical protein